MQQPMSSISKDMMTNLIEAWLDGRLRCSSSRSVFKSPDARFIDNDMMQITAADGSFYCSVSPRSVLLQINGETRPAVVTSNSFGDVGVWVQISAREPESGVFWLELYVPTSPLRLRPYSKGDQTATPLPPGRQVDML